MEKENIPQEKEYYLTNDELKRELFKLKEVGEASEELHLMFLKLAKKYSNRPNFRYYTYKEDMIMTAYMRCIKYANKFDLTRENPFAYFTTTIYREFLKYIAKEKQQQELKWQMMKSVIEDYELETGIKFKYNSSIEEKIYGEKESCEEVEEIVEIKEVI